MNNDIYFVLGVFVCLVYALAIFVIMLLFPRRRQSQSHTLGDLRHKLDNVQGEIKDIQGQVWTYGSTEEERSRRWRIACTALAGKAVSTLQSCWLEREDNPTSQAIYEELLLSLKSVGVEEFIPHVEDLVKEGDRGYRINNKKGAPPYRVSKVIYPGYYFRTSTGSISDQDRVLLEPALVDVLGDLSIV